MQKFKVLAAALLVVGSLPLLVWPFILLPNVMALGAVQQNGEEPERAMGLLLWGSLAYPLVYLLLAVPAIFFLIEGKVIASLIFALCLFGYLSPFLIVVVGAFLG